MLAPISRKLFYVAWIFVLVSNVAFAQSSQPCEVKQYNQKEAKTPLPGVEVMVSNAGSAVSDKNGMLTLTFRTLKPGDKVNLISARKDGFEVMNKEAVDQWNISRDKTPFSLLMVNSAYLRQLKQNLAQVSTDSYRSKYHDAIGEVERLRRDGKMKEEEYYGKLDELERSYQTQLKNLDNYIDQFARIDLSEVSEEEQRILDMAQEGKIDEAVEAYESLDISGKLRRARENRKALTEARARIEAEVAGQDLAIMDLKAKQEREIATLKLAGGKANYDKIALILKENALADTTDIDAMWNYARFSAEQMNYEDALYFYSVCLENGKLGLFEQSLLYNNMGDAYSSLYLLKESEEYYTKALEGFTELYNKDSETYRPNIVHSQNNLAGLCLQRRDLEKAEDFLLLALENCYKLNLDDEANYALLAIIKNNLGQIRFRMADYPKAEQYLLETLDAYRKLVDSKPDQYKAKLASTLNSLGALYTDSQQIDKAFDYYKEALELRKQLCDNNPDAYQSLLADTQYNLGVMFYSLQDFNKAKEYLSSAVENYSVLLSSNPRVYLLELASTRYMLGLSYFKIEDLENAEKVFWGSVDCYTQVKDLYPDDSRYRLAWLYYCLMYLYEQDESKHDRYVDMLNKSLVLFEEIYKNDNSVQAAVDELRTRKDSLKDKKD